MLATRYAHMPIDSRRALTTVDHEIMAFRLAADCFVDCFRQAFIVQAVTQCRSKIGGIILPEAHVKCSGAG